jgi:hypothetical protein
LLHRFGFLTHFSGDRFMITSLVSRLVASGASFDVTVRHFEGQTRTFRVEMWFAARAPEPIYDNLAGTGPVTNDRLSVVEDERGHAELVVFRNANGLVGGTLESRKWVESVEDVLAVAGLS